MTALHDAAYDADERAVAKLLEAGRDPDEVDAKGFTPLAWACLRGAVGDQVPVASLLLAAGADANYRGASNGSDSVLTLAVQSGRVELVELLLRSGADPNLSVEEVTPLMAAARRGSSELVWLLIRNGARAGTSSRGFTAADYAEHHGHDALAAELRTLGAAGEGG